MKTVYRSLKGLVERSIESHVVRFCAVMFGFLFFISPIPVAFFSPNLAIALLMVTCGLAIAWALGVMVWMVWDMTG